MLNSLDLSGTWRVRWADGERGRTEFANRETVDEFRYINAQVPGEVHLDCWREGWILDPYVDTNVLAARWIEECLWSYRREFDAPAEALKAKRQWLVFDGLDLVATIVLNGVEIGRHENVFYPCRLDVTDKLREGKNVLTVHLDSGLYDVAPKQNIGFNGRPHLVLMKRMWMRKPQCQFSWDWSQRLINVGIFKPVRLEWCDNVRADQFVPLVELSRDLKKGTVRGRWFIDAASVAKGKLEIEVVEAGKKTAVDVDLKEGVHAIEAMLDIENPKLWWPVGHGEQHRYTLRATLLIDGQTIDHREHKIGFRHVHINQDPHPSGGRYFNIEINNRKIFCKGGNWVPADMIFQRIDKTRYEKLINLALEQNFNFLRVWGGGMYESDDFYNICDEKGILVWQEFIFACERYPVTDQKFTDNVKVEATWNVRRLAGRPSLIVWCGNNEIEWGSWEWGFDKGNVYPDYSMYHFILPHIVQQEDPTRFYWPSSPYSLDYKSANANDTGDQHPWKIGFYNNDFREYRKMICRFADEGGILGPTALPTMLACLPENHRYVASFAWQIHENAVDSWAEPSYPDEMIRNWLGKEPRKLSIEEFTYWAGFLQGEGLREYVDNFRRRMFDSGAAVFWMYNDTWPCTRSWTTVDYYCRKTPSFHPVRRAMSPISVVLAEEKNQISIFGINETQQPLTAQLRHGIFDFACGFALDASQQVTLNPNSSTPLAHIPSDQWKDRTKTITFAMLTQNEKLIARSRTFDPLFKDIAWPKPNIKVEVKNGRAIFTSDTFAIGVCIDLDGERPIADNFFDVWPAIPYEIPWPFPEKPKILHIGNL